MAQYGQYLAIYICRTKFGKTWFCMNKFGNSWMQGQGDGAFVGHNKLFPFSTVVFASWDYHLTDPDAARNLRHSIRNQLKEMVADAVLKALEIEETTADHLGNYCRRVILHIVIDKHLHYRSSICIFSNSFLLKGVDEDYNFFGFGSCSLCPVFMGCR